MKVYLSGPMSGIPYFNIPRFDTIAHILRDRGFEVVSPAELDDPEFRDLCLQCHTGTIEELHRLCENAGVEQATWGELLARDIRLLADDGVEAVAVLDGWDDSRGAVLETVTARLSNIPVYSVNGEGKLKVLPFGQLEKAHAGCAGMMHKENELPCPPSTRLLPGQLPPPFAFEEVRVTSETGGQKGSKEAVIGDLCPKALMQVARVAGMGRRKYDRLNYLKGFDWSLSYDAAQRHLMEFWSGNDTDEESGLPHLAHAAWQCLCLLAFSIRKIGKDDRP